MSPHCYCCCVVHLGSWKRNVEEKKEKWPKQWQSRLCHVSHSVCQVSLSYIHAYVYLGERVRVCVWVRVFGAAVGWCPSSVCCSYLLVDVVGNLTLPCHKQNEWMEVWMSRQVQLNYNRNIIIMCHGWLLNLFPNWVRSGWKKLIYTHLVFLIFSPSLVAAAEPLVVLYTNT